MKKKPTFTDTVRDIIHDYPTDSRYGFTAVEVGLMLTKHFPNINHKQFWEKFGVNTCMTVDGLTRYYHCDVELTVRLCLENREKKAHEWD